MTGGSQGRSPTVRLGSQGHSRLALEGERPREPPVTPYSYTSHAVAAHGVSAVTRSQ
jgi:hypothetical protein